MSFRVVNNLKYRFETNGDGPPLVLLHGFTGSAANWSPHLPVFARHFQAITVDLPGHGLTDAPADLARYTMGQVATDLVALLGTITDQPAHLLGYSMGGRLALFTALAHPQRFRSLVLESASPGLNTEAERSQRRARDEALADRIEHEGIDWFVNYWENIPLFESQRRLPIDRQHLLRAQRLRNQPAGLANSLRGMGTGVQPSLWDQLPSLGLPVLLLTGALDSKFVAIAHQMYDLLPDAQQVVVPEAGHTVHLEQPDEFQIKVLNFLRGQ